AALGAVPLAEDGTGQRGRGGELEPVEQRGPAAGELDGGHPDRTPRPEGREHGVRAGGGGRQPDGGSDEDEEEHGERRDRRRPPVAAEHDQQARGDGDPWSGGGGGGG